MQIAGALIAWEEVSVDGMLNPDYRMQGEMTTRIQDNLISETRILNLTITLILALTLTLTLTLI